MAPEMRSAASATRAGAGRRRLTRRTLLADLGRVTLGAVVLGPMVSACTGTDRDAETDGASTSRDADTASGGSLAWERASFGFVSAYVLVRDGEAMVFDTGTGDGGVEPITAALDAAGVGWPDVSRVLVSHDHGDHIGGIEAVMAEATAAIAHASGPDFATLQDRVEQAEEVADGDMVLGLRVVGTPGHTLGHVSAFEPDSRLLLTGDAVVRDRQIGGTTGEGIEASPPDFTADAEAAVESVRILADLQPSTMLFGHGDPLADGAADQLSSYAATL